MDLLSKYDKMTDGELVATFKSGDRFCFNYIYLKYNNAAFRLINKTIFNTNESLDVLQEVFIKVYMALPNFEYKSSLGTWIYRIALNTVINKNIKIEKTKYEVDFNDYDYLLDDRSSNPDQLYEYSTFLNKVKSKLSSLNLDLRTVLTLKEYSNMSYADISAVINCPVGTVRSKLHRSRGIYKDDSR